MVKMLKPRWCISCESTELLSTFKCSSKTEPFEL